MSFRVTSLSAVVLSLAAFACTSSADDAAQGGEQNITDGPPVQCMAFPSCGQNEDEVPSCGNLADCRPVSMCGQTIFCAKPPPVQCQAFPVCNPDEEQVDACAAGDAECRPSSMCGHTIHCKKATEVTLEGQLASSAGIGGENTGTSIQTSSGLRELQLEAAERARFVDGRMARAKGRLVTVTGVEIPQRTVVDVSSLLVCPAPGATVNCMPPVQPGNTLCGADRSWAQAKCPNVQFVD